MALGNSWNLPGIQDARTQQSGTQSSNQVFVSVQVLTKVRHADGDILPMLI